MTACATVCGVERFPAGDVSQEQGCERWARMVKRRHRAGTYVISGGVYDAYDVKGQKVRAAIAQDSADAFTK